MKRQCSVPGCEKPHQARGWCKAHWARWNRFGDPVKSPRGWGGHRPRSGLVTYGGAHDRVVRDKGLASEHPCVGCGAPALHWAYDHVDPNEVMDERGTYSLDSSHYIAMCVPCHWRFDHHG